MDLNDKIKYLREKENMTLDELAQKVGVSASTILRYETGNIKNLRRDKIKRLADALNTTPAYLMGWEEEQKDDIDLSKISNILPLPYKNGRTVPLIGTIACGTPILANENVEKEIKLPENIKADFCLRCKGDSMINAHIQDGDIVFIRKQPTVNNGEIAAVLINETADYANATLKRVYLYDNRIMLSAENPKYSPLIYIEEEMNDIQILGKAVAFLSAIK